MRMKCIEVFSRKSCDCLREGDFSPARLRKCMLSFIEIGRIGRFLTQEYYDCVSVAGDVSSNTL